MKRTVEAMLGYFNQIRRVYANELNARFQSENFSPNEISILILLSNNPSINTSSQLTTILSVSKGLISRSIDALTDKGYVTCKQDISDKRITRIELTPESFSVIQLLKKEIEEINKELLSDISEEEISQMEATMSKIITRFKERTEN